MFGKLRKKIFGSIFTVILIFVLSVSIISFCVIVSNLYEAQAERTEDNAYSGVKGCQAYFSAVMGIVENLLKTIPWKGCSRAVRHGISFPFWTASAIMP